MTGFNEELERQLAADAERLADEAKKAAELLNWYRSKRPGAAPFTTTKLTGFTGTVKPSEITETKPTIDLAMLPPAPSERKTFADDVRDVVMRLGDQEFSVPMIERALIHAGKKVPEANSRSRISMILAQLAKNKEIALIHEGKGSDPNRYKLAVNGLLM